MGYRDIATPFETLAGKVIIAIDGLVNGGDSVIFTCDDGSRYIMHHNQDCCERVEIIDVCGSTLDILGSTILVAEKRTSEPNDPDGNSVPWRDEAGFWTFYHLSTIHGRVDIRWYGSSNGYYGMGVDFERLVS